MSAACQCMFYLSATRGRRSFLTLFEDETCVVRIALASCTPPQGSMEVAMGPAAWGESEGAEPDSPSSVLETLALHPSGNSKVRRMSKEFERLLQHRACAQCRRIATGRTAVLRESGGAAGCECS